MNAPSEPLRRSDLDSDPWTQFAAWKAEADATGLREAGAVALSTVDADGQPSARMVAIRRWNADGFPFFTNYESRKGGALGEQTKASLLWYWDALARQIRVEGTCIRLPDDASEAYFQTRPRGAQVSAHASPQSEVVPNRDFLEKSWNAFDAQHIDQRIPRPDHWGGYLLQPTSFEFWQHDDDRLHDRFRYRREGGGWVIERLAP